MHFYVYFFFIISFLPRMNLFIFTNPQQPPSIYLSLYENSFLSKRIPFSFKGNHTYDDLTLNTPFKLVHITNILTDLHQIQNVSFSYNHRWSFYLDNLSLFTNLSKIDYTSLGITLYSFILPFYLESNNDISTNITVILVNETLDIYDYRRVMKDISFMFESNVVFTFTVYKYLLYNSLIVIGVICVILLFWYVQIKFIYINNAFSKLLPVQKILIMLAVVNLIETFSIVFEILGIGNKWNGLSSLLTVIIILNSFFRVTIFSIFYLLLDGWILITTEFTLHKIKTTYGVFLTFYIFNLADQIFDNAFQQTFSFVRIYFHI